MSRLVLVLTSRGTWSAAYWVVYLILFSCDKYLRTLFLNAKRHVQKNFLTRATASAAVRETHRRAVHWAMFVALELLKTIHGKLEERDKTRAFWTSYLHVNNASRDLVTLLGTWPEFGQPPAGFTAQLSTLTIAMTSHFTSMPSETWTRMAAREKALKTGETVGDVQPSRPPKLGAYLLLLCLSKKDREPLLGDLEEDFSLAAEQYGIFAARAAYWTEVFRSIGPVTGARLWKLALALIELLRWFH